MEDKSMKFTKLTILTGIFLLLFSLSIAGKKSVKEDHVSSINSNIINEELRIEIEILMQDFDEERLSIMDYYTEKIEKLKEEKQLEIKTIIKEYGDKREAILIKYGEDRKLLHSKPDRPNFPDKKKRIPDKRSP